MPALERGQSSQYKIQPIMSEVLNTEMECADILLGGEFWRELYIEWRTSEIAFVSQALAPAHWYSHLYSKPSSSFALLHIVSLWQARSLKYLKQKQMGNHSWICDAYYMTGRSSILLCQAKVACFAAVLWFKTPDLCSLDLGKIYYNTHPLPKAQEGHNTCHMP